MKSYIRNKTLFFVPDQDLISDNLADYRDQMLKKLSKSSNYNDIIINMKSVSTIDSSGISLLFGLNKEISSQNKSLKLVDLDESLNKIFDIFNLKEQLEIDHKEISS